GGPFEAPRVLAYADPMDWGPRPDALHRLDELRINDALLDRLAAITVDPAAIRPSDVATEGAREGARDPAVMIAPGVESAPPAAVAAETPSAVARAVVTETPPVAAAPAVVEEALAVDAPIAVVAKAPTVQITETRSVDTERASPVHTTILLAAVEIAAKANYRAASLRANWSGSI